MSTDWHIICLDCGDKNVTYGDHVHRFNDANWKDELMWDLIKQHEAIAALDDLMSVTGSDVEFRLSGSYGAIDTAWFKKHLGHQLWPIDEYGRLDTQCRGRVTCDQGHHHDCQLADKHEGPHDARGRYKR